MFQYHHPPRRFGLRGLEQAIQADPLADLKLFAGAYLAGIAFVLAFVG